MPCIVLWTYHRALRSELLRLAGVEPAIPRLRVECIDPVLLQAREWVGRELNPAPRIKSPLHRRYASDPGAERTSEGVSLTHCIKCNALWSLPRNLHRFGLRSFSKRVALPRSRDASPFAPPRRIELHSSGFQPDTLTISAKAARVRRRRFELLVFALKGRRAEPGCTNVASRGDRRDLRPLQPFDKLRAGLVHSQAAILAVA